MPRKAVMESIRIYRNLSQVGESTSRPISKANKIFTQSTNARLWKVTAEELRNKIQGNWEIKGRKQRVGTYENACRYGGTRETGGMQRASSSRGITGTLLGRRRGREWVVREGKGAGVLSGGVVTRTSLMTAGMRAATAAVWMAADTALNAVQVVADMNGHGGGVDEHN
ncbi:hypothetical protein K438DRAFT_1781587 [Mycena galopus ATCC 62051]|nr:hypothetical protein K438DRAFT_1781587 [Mycena galopus ATCC 62051]